MASQSVTHRVSAASAFIRCLLDHNEHLLVTQEGVDLSVFTMEETEDDPDFVSLTICGRGKTATVPVKSLLILLAAHYPCIYEDVLDEVWPDRAMMGEV